MLFRSGDGPHHLGVVRTGSSCDDHSPRELLVLSSSASLPSGNASLVVVRQRYSASIRPQDWRFGLGGVGGASGRDLGGVIGRDLGGMGLLVRFGWAGAYLMRSERTKP